ncbi:response regulator [Chitinophaga sp. GCM10012297]|uniref:Response regulator transcription factor n=1 Tax=Chitinophaga chungangae TaxID=2821488 RepID=A0ABS3YAE3_9BACT|nr:response regulator transcription factor [Chitinophaga chungangae]MBO9151648.1 response regulator transcription factor [Chitinophaga chungangae]
MKAILVADDHSIVRLGVSHIISTLATPSAVEEASTFDEVITYLEAKRFDLLILDINIPGGNNLQMIDAVKLRQPNIRILMFSGYDEQLFAINYMQAGADGYLVKYSPEDEIRSAISTVLNQQKYMSAGTKEQLLSMLNSQREPVMNPLSTLSGREVEVMYLLTKGIPVARIADMLNLQVTTVSTYKTRIFEKLQISNIVELLEKVKMYSTAN